MTRTVKPYDPQGSKKHQIREMFNRISPRYDFLNHFLSAGIDYRWRNRLVRMMARQRPSTVLDIATGTGDLAILEAQKLPARITAVDISEGMLQIAREKIKKKGLADRITLMTADAENLPFTSGSFEAVSVAFGVRNFENLERGLSEMARVLKPGGTAYILEFSQPRRFPFKQLYGFYARHILPRIGKLISGDPSAYTYLPESIAAFPYGNEMAVLLRHNGFREAVFYPLTFGISTLYLAKK